MLTGIVIYFQCAGLQGGCDLYVACLASAGGKWGGVGGSTLSRMASSTGVVDIVDMSRVRPDKLRRSIGANGLRRPS